MFSSMRIAYRSRRDPKACSIKLTHIRRDVPGSINEFYLFGDTITTNSIDWKAIDKPRLWRYHLHYFDFLEGFDADRGLALIEDWIKQNQPGKSAGWDPYPTSIRVINWIKFSTKHDILSDAILDSLFKQGRWLFGRREKHLYANHLFKNTVALLFLGYLFSEKTWLNWAIKNCERELEEQITKEGLHFEFSPTYHAIFIQDMLDASNIFKNNGLSEFYPDLNSLLIQGIERSLAWAYRLSEKSRYLPINDTNEEGCPHPETLRQYAKELGIVNFFQCDSSTSEYFPQLVHGKFRVILNCTPFSPSYNPAHSHADKLGILIWHHDEPILVDTGNFCYEESKERTYARSTAAHNTIALDANDQAELWRVFRIGRRGKVSTLQAYSNVITGKYDFRNTTHIRSIKTTEEGLILEDSIIARGRHTFSLFFHFSPEVEVQLKRNKIVVNHNLFIILPPFENRLFETFYFPRVYTTRRKKTVGVTGSFTDTIQLLTEIL